MGIKGLTSLLMETGLWSSTSRGTKHFHDDNNKDDNHHDNPNTNDTTVRSSTILEEDVWFANDPNDPNKQKRNTDKDIIEPGSTFLIDGPSFAFHCYSLAYYKYYQDTIDSFTKTRDLFDKIDEKEEYHFTGDDILHLVHMLLPTCMPYKYIHDVTNHLLQSFAISDIHCIVFYEDGHNHPTMDTKSLLSYMDIHKFKAKTQAYRDQQRQESQDRLTSFLVQQILPTSFASVKKTSEMPSAHVFVQEFPLPPLLHSQVRHSIQVFAHMYPYHMTIRRCYGECDRAIAMMSYNDTSHKTFALSNDSDYILFGPMTQNEVQNVQYIPLDTLELQDTNTIKGTILTRCKVAEALHVTKRVLLEASIVMGNDYTSYFMEQEHARSTINFFQDLKKESQGKIYDRMNKQDIIDGMTYLMERNPMYQVTSDDSRIQRCIEFSRAWFTFNDISSFSSNDCHPVVSHEAQDVESQEDIDSLGGPSSDIHDEFSSDLEFIQGQIILLFIQTSKDENDFSDAAAMLSLLDWAEMSKQPSNFLLSTSVKYLHHIQVSRFQKCIRKVLQSCFQESYNQNAICDLNGDILYNQSEEYHDMESSQVVPFTMGPSDLFHPIKFCNYLASKDVLARQHLTANQCNTGIHQSSSSGLPIDEYRNAILSSIMNNRVTIIEGETGSGKSSKVPIMIMEEPPPDPRFNEVKMFICQPRRIAAKSLVERVRSITTGHLKSMFALRMGHGHKEYETQNSRAFFVTTGYMVRYLANNMHSFHNVTHLIIDEVHERSVDSDILCLLAKRLLAMHPHLRLVLMSATVASVKYREYFDSRTNSIFVGRRCFPIKEMFLEDIGKELLFGSKEQQQIDLIRKESLQARCLESPNSQYMSVLHRLSVLLATSVARKGSSVLIFVPGMADIIAISEMFEDIVTATNYVVQAVHSDIPFDEQMEIFDSRKNGEVRVIVATNAAESSITLPDVDHVLDFGLHKTIRYNAKSHRQRLEACWISKASAIQRMGRTGRVRPGTVYRLYPKEIFTDYMVPFDAGEILRVPLDTTILNLRTIINGSISSILKQCIEPPDVSNIQNSFLSLFERRFISRPDDNFEMTPIGNLVAELGLDLNLGAIISMGILFGLIPETIEMAAILSCPKTPWLIPNSILQEVDVYNDIVKKTYSSKRMFDGGNYSDVFAIMNLLWDYNQISSSKRHQFAKENAVSLPRLNSILSTRKNLQLRVSSHLEVPLVSLCSKQSPREMTSSKLTVLRLIKTWIFHDSLIALSPTKKRMDTGAFSLKLQGNPVNKSQFRSILDCDSFHLDSMGEVRYKGRHEATSIDYVPLVLDAKAFESRLLSLVIEKNVKVLCHRASDWIYLYSITADVIGKMQSMLQFDDDVYVTESMESHRNISNHKGWRGRICGTWKVLGSTSRETPDAVLTTDDDNRINISCQRYNLGSILHAKRKYKVLASSLLPFRSQFDIVFIEADPSKTHGPIEIHHYSRTHNIYFEASELKDLFSTPHIRLQTVHTKYSQELVFGENKEIIHTKSSHKGWFETTQAPWEVRLLTALACSQRTYRKPFLSLPKAVEDGEGQLFQNQDDDKNDTTNLSFSIISFDVENLRGQWKWVETEGNAVVDRMSIPATITPQIHVVYACCGNILELKGGAILAENLTILPPSENFVSLAFTCFGLPPPMNSSGTDEDSLEFCRNGMEEIDLSGVDLECAICLSELRHPKITNCRHLFCKNCIISLINSTTNNNTPRCPCCRFELELNEIKDVVSKGMNERIENAKRFNHTLKMLMTSTEKKSLCYSRDLVELLCNVFHNLDGLEVLPWDNSMTMQVRSSEPMTKQENPIDFLLKEMGRNNLPSSFIHLLDEKEEIMMQDIIPITSNHHEIQGDMDNNASVIGSAGDFLQNLLLTNPESNAILQHEQGNENTTHDELNADSISCQRGVDLTAAVMSSRCYTHPSICDE